LRHNLVYWLKTTTQYGILVVGFSIIGIFLETATLPENPLNSATYDHILGHIIWGMIIAVPTLSLKYIVASGLFAIVLDADHLINFFGIEIVSRLGHSIPFAIIASVVMLMIFGRKDYLLGAISFAAVLSHMSFDTLLGSGDFPIFAPFDSSIIIFQGWDWIYLLISGIIIVTSIKFLIFKKEKFGKKLST